MFSYSAQTIRGLEKYCNRVQLCFDKQRVHYDRRHRNIASGTFNARVHQRDVMAITEISVSVDIPRQRAQLFIAFTWNL